MDAHKCYHKSGINTLNKSNTIHCKGCIRWLLALPCLLYILNDHSSLEKGLSLFWHTDKCDFLLGTFLALHLATKLELAIATGAHHSFFSFHTKATPFAETLATVAFFKGNIFAFAHTALPAKSATGANGCIIRQTIFGWFLQIHQLPLWHGSKTFAYGEVIVFIALNLGGFSVRLFQIVANLTEIVESQPAGLRGTGATNAVAFAHPHHSFFDCLQSKRQNGHNKPFEQGCPVNTYIASGFIVVSPNLCFKIMTTFLPIQVERCNLGTKLNIIAASAPTETAFGGFFAILQRSRALTAVSIASVAVSGHGVRNSCADDGLNESDFSIDYMQSYSLVFLTHCQMATYLVKYF